jgi:predicted site-specific integrase-resolvase
MEDEPLIGSDEAAEIIGVHRATILRWAASGKLTVIYRGRGPNGAAAFSRSQVQRLARERFASRESA